MMRHIGTIFALPLVLASGGCSEDSGDDGGPDDTGSSVDGGPQTDGGDSGNLLEIDVSEVFARGTRVRDAYSGTEATVDDDGRVRFDPTPRGVVLIEDADTSTTGPTPFTWDNATVYFVMLDRFENGDRSNDNGYGRDFSDMPATGTFHGGDLRGLTDRLDYIDGLGVNAIWITAPFEQIHGYVSGGNGAFPHFGYAGYWALDFTRLDANFGTSNDLRAFVDSAHQRGIRVIFDVVMNHPGYATLPEIETYLPEVLQGSDWQQWRPGPGETWSSFNDLFIDYNHPDWPNWWGSEWIRAGLPGYDRPGSGDLLLSLDSLPDFKTEAADPTSGLPPMLAAKTDTEATPEADFTVRDYLVQWLSAWVREYGIDGFRCDTAKHVELDAWAELKVAGTEALRAWKAQNPDKALDDLDFWMTGEVFGRGVVKDEYYTTGRFDSLINFEFKNDAASVSLDASELEALYARYDGLINTDPEFNVLSYISSHDTSLFFETTNQDMNLQYRVASALLLAPGGVQIYYGDETARAASPGNGDSTAGTRSDMNWDGFDPELVEHWSALGQFRRRHPAIGAGTHRAMVNDQGTYVFSRTLSMSGEMDQVVVAITGFDR